MYNIGSILKLINKSQIKLIEIGLKSHEFGFYPTDMEILHKSI